MLRRRISLKFFGWGKSAQDFAAQALRVPSYIGIIQG